MANDVLWGTHYVVLWRRLTRWYFSTQWCSVNFYCHILSCTAYKILNQTPLASLCQTFIKYWMILSSLVTPQSYLKLKGECYLQNMCNARKKISWQLNLSSINQTSVVVVIVINFKYHFCLKNVCVCVCVDVCDCVCVLLCDKYDGRQQEKKHHSNATSSHDPMLKNPLWHSLWAAISWLKTKNYILYCSTRPHVGLLKDLLLMCLVSKGWLHI